MLLLASIGVFTMVAVCAVTIHVILDDEHQQRDHTSPPVSPRDGEDEPLMRRRSPSPTPHSWEMV